MIKFIQIKRTKQQRFLSNGSVLVVRAPGRLVEAMTIAEIAPPVNDVAPDQDRLQVTVIPDLAPDHHKEVVHRVDLIDPFHVAVEVDRFLEARAVEATKRINIAF